MESLTSIDPRMLAKIHGLRLRARHIVEGYVAGLHRSPYHGFSIEFAEHREYAPGDDLRYVDWKVFGKSDKVYLKQYEDETNLLCYLVLDVSESMTYRGPAAALSKLEYAHSLATRVQAAVKEHKPLSLKTESRAQDGTTHLNSIDRDGNMVALTLTHGNSFGACVTVEGLGLTLGHGMSRFNPEPGHPNSPGPGKRPLHNMCPTIILKNGTPVLALGATGGRMIPNSIFDVLTHYVVLGAALDDAIAAPRLHTEGNLHLTMEPRWPMEDVEYFKALGYTLKSAATANVQAMSFDPVTGAVHSAAR